MVGEHSSWGRECLALSLGLIVALAPVSAAQERVIGNFPVVAVPPENPLTPEKVLLGMALFFEEQMSADDTMACATCHLPEAGGGDPNGGAREAGADQVLFTADDEFGSSGVVLQDAQGDFRHHPLYGVGRQPTPRNSPSAINAAFFQALFWDQRALPVFRDEADQVVLSDNAALESQAVGPFVSSVEMGHEGQTWAELTAKLARVRPLDLASDLPPRLEQFLDGSERYGPLFERAFGTEEITRERVAMAIASYERTLVSDRSPFDLGTMTPQQELGFDIFFERSFGNCNTCHPQGNRLFSNAATRTIFLPDHDRRVKVPSLRNVGLRPRFMSSGQFTTMQEVLEHYQSIGFLDPLDPDQTAALIDFLMNALTDPRVARREPPFDRPILRSERAPHGSNLFGRPRGGSGAFQPEILADVPANLGNPDFRIGLGRGLGGAPAVLALAQRRGKLGSAPRNSIFVDLSTARLVSFVLSGTQPGEGVATFRAALPVDPALLGLERYAQWFVLDPGASGGIAASQAARFELFRR